MRTLRLLLLVAAVATPLAAQGNGFYDARSAVTGVQFKTYSFGDGGTWEKASQVAIPLAAVIPISARLSLDVGTFYAITSTTTASDGDQSVSGLTDLQVRGAYTLGRDAAVLSLVVNVPTGVKFDGEEAITAGAAASNFLLFPVNSYSNGLSATGGVGLAKRMGDWGVGVAGSFRWNGEYRPYVDGTAIINGTDTIVDPTYEAGFEGKIRVGADRSLGQGRFRVGLTFSTFGDDTYGAGSGSDTKYSPGNRFIAEGSYTWPGFGGTVSAYAWNYHRSGGATDNTDVSNSENILTAGLMARRGVGPNTTFEPAVEGRFGSFNAGDGGGKVVALGVGLRHRVSDRISIVPNARFEIGTLDPGVGDNASLTGFGGSVFLRYGF